MGGEKRTETKCINPLHNGQLLQYLRRIQEIKTKKWEEREKDKDQGKERSIKAFFFPTFREQHR